MGRDSKYPSYILFINEFYGPIPKLFCRRRWPGQQVPFICTVLYLSMTSMALPKKVMRLLQKEMGRDSKYPSYVLYLSIISMALPKEEMALFCRRRWVRTASKKYAQSIFVLYGPT
jgi:hypothetical protein